MGVVVGIVVVASKSCCACVGGENVRVVVVVLTNRLWEWVGLARLVGHLKGVQVKE